MSSGYIHVVACRECGEVTFAGRCAAFDCGELEEELVSLLRSPERNRIRNGVCWVCLCSQAAANDSDGDGVVEQADE